MKKEGRTFFWLLLALGAFVIVGTLAWIAIRDEDGVITAREDVDVVTEDASEFE